MRKKYAAAYEQKGARLTLTSFALKVVVDTLKKHPIFNASLDEVAQEIVFKQYYHIGIAVDTEAGLIVPVIRDADKKNLLELSRELEDLAGKARERKVSAEELKGGTFTISNQGGIGGGQFTPIVNKPQVAILGLGRGAMKAVVRDNTDRAAADVADRPFLRSSRDRRRCRRALHRGPRAGLRELQRRRCEDMSGGVLE